MVPMLTVTCGEVWGNTAGETWRPCQWGAHKHHTCASRAWQSVAPTSSSMTDRTSSENVWYTITSKLKPRKEDSSHAVSSWGGNLMAAVDGSQ